MLTTPQKKSWLSLTPRSDNPKSSANPRIGGSYGVGKGKEVSVFEPSSTHSPVSVYGSGGIAAAERVDSEALLEKVSKLENELFEYQYNMGLLLMEKKEWSFKCEDLENALAEAQAVHKREQAAHLIAISNSEKREENLRKALGVEKQCVNDLEKILREIRAEYAEIKFTADSKLSEANALAIRIEEKSLEVEAKLWEADAKLAEASRMSSDVERKKQDVDVRESALKRTRLSMKLEREAHESTLSKQKEDLREWERKLQEGEERLCEAQRILNEREERVNEFEKRYKQKENDLGEAQKKIDMGNKELKKAEEEINSKFKSLKVKEKEVDEIRKRVEKKETELCVWDLKLSDRENTELQKLLDDHKAKLDAKNQDFELEINQRRKSIDEELRSKVVAVKNREAEVDHAEAVIAKREEALEKKLEKLKQKEKDLDSKSKALKEEEESIKAEEKRLDEERKQVLSDKENLDRVKVELEQKEVNLGKQLQRVVEEKERLKVTEEERSDHNRLQSELKREIEKCRHQKEELMGEAEALRQERESFEKEWEALDEKKAEIEKELKNTNEEKENLDKLRRTEEERLRNDTLAAKTNIEGEMEALMLAKESFAAETEHDKSLMSQTASSERTKMLNDIELRKRELEIEMQTKMEGIERSLREKERVFEDERDKELIKITALREEVEREAEDIKVEKRRVEKQKEEVETNRRSLEEQRFQIQKDIDELVVLSGKLKNQREQFLKERERFITFVKEHESCQKCGELTHEFIISDLHSLHEIEGGEILPLPNLTVNYLKNQSSPGLGDAETPKSAGKVSALVRKCASKIFLFSPIKNSEKTALQNMESFEAASEGLGGEGDEPGLNDGVVSDSLETRRDSGDDTSVREDSNINNNENQEAETTQLSGLKVPESGRKRGKQRITRTSTMKAVVKDAEAILGHDLEQESLEDSSLAGSRNGRKRSRAQTSGTNTDLLDDDENSDSITVGGGGKRRQKVARAVQAPVKRYNLRKPRNLVDGPTIAPCSTKRNRLKTRQTKSVQEEAKEETSEAPDARPPLEITVTSDDVNKTPDGNGYSDSSFREAGDGHEEDEDETQHPGEVSVGKKLWTFFTT